MFERFTDRARKVVVLAQEHARTSRHDAIDLPHFLAALVSEKEGVAAQVLADLGVTEVNLGDPGERVPSGHIPYTERSKKFLELSLREALQLGHRYIGTEHLLLGLVREGTIAHLVPMPLSEVRHAVIKKLGGYSQPEAAQRPQEQPRRPARRSSCAEHSFTIGGRFAICNRCEKVVHLKVGGE